MAGSCSRTHLPFRSLVVATTRWMYIIDPTSSGVEQNTTAATVYPYPVTRGQSVWVKLPAQVSTVSSVALYDVTGRQWAVQWQQQGQHLELPTKQLAAELIGLSFTPTLALLHLLPRQSLCSENTLQPQKQGTASCSAFLFNSLAKRILWLSLHPMAFSYVRATMRCVDACCCPSCTLLYS